MSPCTACGVAGHRIGNEVCKALPSQEIVAFRTYQHPLSNQYLCELQYCGSVFKSIEHAFLWKMAEDFGRHVIADSIRNSKHAGAAQRISREISDDESRWKWERDNTALMEELLLLKLDQCAAFKESLLENQHKILAVATFNKFWGTGLSIFASENTSPSFWPGQNTLGAMLMEVTVRITSNHHDPVLPVLPPVSESSAALPFFNTISSVLTSIHDDTVVAATSIPASLPVVANDPVLSCELASTPTDAPSNVTDDVSCNSKTVSNTCSTPLPSDLPPSSSSTTRPNIGKGTRKGRSRARMVAPRETRSHSPDRSNDNRRNSICTPKDQQDIRKAFEAGGKRKSMASSPNDEDTKAKRIDNFPKETSGNTHVT